MSDRTHESTITAMPRMLDDTLDPDVLARSIHLEDAPRVAEALICSIRETARRFRRTGAVVALSGGIDSSVCLGLASRALGPRRVVGLALPESESSGESAVLAGQVADVFGVELHLRDITGALEALGCYRDRLDVVRRIDPSYDPARDQFSVEFDAATGDGDRVQSFTLNIVSDGVATQHRLGGQDFRTIMAATNQKQRVRMLVTYRIADERNLIVVGTSNRLELDQGFFVKHGDGCGEVFPLRHLLKSHVYDLAEYLGVPDEIRERPPTTDTFSAPQTQEDFFFGASTELGDRLWLAWQRGDTPAEVAAQVPFSEDSVAKFFDLYARRSQYAEYLTETI